MHICVLKTKLQCVAQQLLSCKVAADQGYVSLSRKAERKCRMLLLYL